MPASDQTILLQTKLHRPRLPSNLVTRSRLIELLNHDLDRQLILVCAPAGFGKTTLVSTWLSQLATNKTGAQIPTAWLSLDENDNNLNLFLRYFIAALRTIFKQACEQTQALLQAQRKPPITAIYTTFINELEKLPGDALIVLDDYHSISNTEVHELLSELVSHWPEPLHLVLISRLSPPIPLSSLRARGMLSEIRTRDLRFTTEETTTYLTQFQSGQISQNTIPVLEERLEGWPAGLHLATLSLRSSAGRESMLTLLSKENVNITEYLVDEVLNEQFPAIYSFLLKTSILDRFCVSLCQVIIGDIDPAWDVSACLDWIERSELFLIPLDDRQEWYRYHHLFQELLQRKLSTEMAPEEINKLHLRGSSWFEEQGLIDEALQHALAAGDLELAAHQMYASLCDTLNREDRPTLERWLRLLPEEMIRQDPRLLMVRAWALQFLWQLDLQAKVLQQIEEILDTQAVAMMPVEDMQILRAQILLIQSQYTFFSNQTTRTIDLCREVLSLMPPSWTFGRGSAMLYLGFSMQANGQFSEAEKLLLDEFELCVDKTDVYPLILLQTLDFIYLITGELEKAKQIGQVMIQGATQSENSFTKNWGNYYIGVASYLRNELETAYQYFSEILNNRYVAHFTVYRDAVAGLALIHQLKGESAEAWQMVDSISQYDLGQMGSEDERTRALRARLMLLQGDLEGARRWADTISSPPPDQPYLWLEEPQVTRLRILLASQTKTDRQLALESLDVLDEIIERTHNTRFNIEILALRALALDAQGQTVEADRLLKQALELARPGGFIRVFVDMGVPMQVILQRLLKQGYSGELMERILAAFPEDEKDLSRQESPASLKSQPSPEKSILVEPLTTRELGVLTLLREPISIKEIALKLNISYATAKRHTINIYGKLGVHQRWKAVAKAEELHLLPAK